MKTNRASLLWGILLVGAGALALAQQMGMMHQLPEQLWVWVFALISLVGFVSYGLSGWKEWGWLFPAGVFGGLAITVGLALAHVNSAAMAAPIFVGLLVPFAAAYLLDRSHNWWALIPGGVMLFLTFTMFLADSGGAWVGALFLFMLALAFLIVYLNHKTRQWALLVAYIMAILGIAPMMSSLGESAAYYGGVFLLAAALPFLYAYLQSRDRWWPIIPACVLIALAAITVAAVAGWINDAAGGSYAGAVLMAGLAAAFAVIWLRHGKAWARVVTIVMAALAVAAVFLAAKSEVLWPVAIMAAGAYLLINATRKRAA